MGRGEQPERRNVEGLEIVELGRQAAIIANAIPVAVEALAAALSAIFIPWAHGSLQGLNLLRRDVPEHNMVVRIGHSCMSIIVIDIDVVHLRIADGQCIEGLPSPKILEGYHIDGADEIALPVIGEKGSRR